MDWSKVNIFVGHRGEVRGQFRAAAVPVAKAQPKTVAGLAIRGAFRAIQSPTDSQAQIAVQPVPSTH